MSIVNNARLNDIEKKLGFYPSITFIASEARKLRFSLDYDITESQALAWVLSGVTPERHKIPIKDLEYSISLEDRLLTYIDKPAIKKSVKLSVEDTEIHHHLIYRYTADLNESEKARVRILTRVIWYNDN